MHCAKRSCISYLKCVHMMRDKSVFKFDQIDQQKLAEAHGLVMLPQLDFDPGQASTVKTMSRAEQRKLRVQMMRERV